MLTCSKRMFLSVGILAVLAIVSGGHGLSVSPAASAKKMTQDSAPYRAGHSAHPHIDMQAHWDEYTVATDTPPQVVVPGLGGVIMTGKQMVTINERPLAAYQGIKYGESERFKHSTVAGQYWGSDIHEITVDHTGPKCSQISMLGHFGTGSEDCLYLDIYVPEVEDPTPLPVMLFIHGGSFTGGDSSLYLPTRLLDKDVILVVIQYRLGALGWLALQNEDVPGNAGLSDQIAALQWVQLHIEAFGGDHDRVTIFGESAGSTSVSLLQTIGPITEGMFAGVIGESGSALEHWAIDEEPIQSAFMFATEVCGCVDATSEKEIYDCLMKKEHEEITLCTSSMVSSQREKGKMGFEVCSPVVQRPDVPEQWRLITKMPSEYIEAGEAVDVPLMMGANRDEGSFVFGVMYLDYLVPTGLANDSDYIANGAINDVMAAFGVEDTTHSLTEMVQEKYFPGVKMSSIDAVSPGMIDMVGVFFLKAGTYEVAKLHSSYYTTNTFFYSFDYVSDNSMFNLLFAGYTDQIPFEHGVTHSDELMYLFSFPTQLNDGQRLTSQRLVTLWTNFAIYGNPTPDEMDNYSELGLPKWEMLDLQNLHYLLIQDEVTVEKDYTQRWTIEMDLQNPDGVTTTSTAEPGDWVSQKEYDDLEKTKNDYEITMIVFICLFLVECGVSAYYFFKYRSASV